MREVITLDYVSKSFIKSLIDANEGDRYILVTNKPLSKNAAKALKSEELNRTLVVESIVSESKEELREMISRVLEK